MRKLHKELISSIVANLNEACYEIEKACSEKNKKVLDVLLADCADVCEQICNYIIQLDGEGVKTVKFLEEFADILNKVDCENNFYNDNFKKQLFLIKESVENDIKADKLEVVFFPYRASMWDSLESIYFAAKEDPQCEVYVVVIPFFEVNDDKSFGKMFYEGADFPKNIQIIDWKAYDIEARRPDIIFTHNPYDNETTNFSIHPDFYAARLREYCDMVVHVPYYVVSGDTYAYNLWSLPGVINAHKVIVQSEAAKQVCINNYNECDKNLGWNGKYGKAEEKFIALGSPKFDKVINSKREDFELPEAWKKLIFKPDGTRKKIVLYNTHFIKFIGGGSLYFDKLKSVFDIFRERDDVVLWWRPHPNCEISCKLKRPEMYDFYKEFIANYKREGFGIYDDTADLHRAITWSDAFYGDESSILVLYGVTEKPILIQTVNIIPVNYVFKNLTFINLYDDGENFWFTEYSFNALFKMNKQTWKAEYMGSFPNEKADKYGLYGHIAECKGKLYFSPLNANEIGVYDIKTKKFTKIVINTNQYEGLRKFASIAVYKDYVFFIAYKYPAIIRYNTINKKLDYYTDWIDKINIKSTIEEKFYFSNVYVSNNKMFAAAASTNFILVFDMETCTSNIYKVGSSKHGYRGICFDGEHFWLAPGYDGPIVRWNFDTGEYKEFNNLPHEYRCADQFKIAFINIICSGGFVWVFPHWSNTLLKINPGDESITVADKLQFCWATGADGDKIYTCTVNPACFSEYNCATNERREKVITFPNNDEKLIDFCETAFQKDINLYTTSEDCLHYIDESFLTLRNYLKKVVCDSEELILFSNKHIELYKNKMKNLNGLAGSKIMQLYIGEIL